MTSPQNPHLVKAIVDLAVFLEFTDSRLLDEDTSIQAMEHLASELQLIDTRSRIELARQIRSLAEAYADSPTREFIANLPEALGLV
jgi:hypothetical protein